MALPQHFVIGRGGTLVLDHLDVRPGAMPGPTVSVFGPDNTAYVTAAAATIDAVNTTLSSAAAVGAETVAVTSAAGIVVGRAYLIADASDMPERVRVRRIAGTTITLAAVLKYPHLTASAFQSTRVIYGVTAAQATTMFRRGRAVWLWSHPTAGTTEQSVQSVACIRYSYENAVQMTDLDVVDPRWFEKVDAYFDFDATRTLAFDLVAERTSGHVDPHDAVGANAFQMATVWQLFLLMADRYGAAFSAERDRYAANLDRALRDLRRVHPFDVDRDQVIRRPGEVGFVDRSRFVG